MDRRDGIYRVLSRTISPESPQHVALPQGPGFPDTYAEIGPRTEADSLHLASTTNDNQSFYLHVRYPGASMETCRELALLLDGRWLVSELGIGWDPDGCSGSFNLTAAAAERVAERLGCELHTRHAIGMSSSGQFAVFSDSAYRDLVFEGRRSHLARVRPNERCTRRIVLRIENPTTAEGFLLRTGGRYRGPRNNRFAFRVWRDGVELQSLAAPDMGGIEGLVKMRSGSSYVVSEILDRWADVSTPGAYEVECWYATTLSPTGLVEAASERALWDRTYSGTVTF